MSNPPCIGCGNDTTTRMVGMIAPSADERGGGASRVEHYSCSSCRTFTRWHHNHCDFSAPSFGCAMFLFISGRSSSLRPCDDILDFFPVPYPRVSNSVEKMFGGSRFSGILMTTDVWMFAACGHAADYYISWQSCGI